MMQKTKALTSSYYKLHDILINDDGLDLVYIWECGYHIHNNNNNIAIHYGNVIYLYLLARLPYKNASKGVMKLRHA